ncbi:MAG: hypothetical protein RJA45_82, partial [Actinomycetota bacterium]
PLEATRKTVPQKTDRRANGKGETVV